MHVLLMTLSGLQVLTTLSSRLLELNFGSKASSQQSLGSEPHGD